MSQETKAPPREMETLEGALKEMKEGSAIFVVDEIPAFATKRELGAVKSRITKLEKCVREIPELPELPELPDISEAFNEVVDNLENRITKLRRETESGLETLLATFTDPDGAYRRELDALVKTNNEMVETNRESMKATIEMSKVNREVAAHVEVQVVELRTALANLVVAAAETRKTADKCAELLGVVT